jgi:membrane protein
VPSARQVLTLAKDTFKEFSDDEATWKAAALSYFTVFALAPLLVILLQVASLIWDPAQVRDALTGQFQALMGRDVAHQVQTMMMSAERKTASGSGIRLVLSIAGLLFGATGAFVSLQQAINRAWEVEPDPRRGGVKNFITKRFLSLGMVLGIAFLLLVSLAVTAALSAAGDALFGGLGGVVAQTLNFILTFAVIALLFAAIFKVLPDAKVEWRDVWVGAIATAVFFVVGKFLIGLYIGQSNPGSAFGAAGALAVLLVWIYYAAVIILLGAEFTQAWMKMHGREIEPEEGAVRVVEVKKRVGDSAPPKGSGGKVPSAGPSTPGRVPNGAPAFVAARSERGGDG